MNVDQLKIFLQVVQYGSFEQAAKKNFLSQRAVSKQMSQLESELGTNLFERGKNKIYLSPQGSIFLPSAQDIVNNLANVISDLKKFDNEQCQTIQVGYFSPFEGQIVQNSLYQLTQVEPNASITIHEQSNEHLAQSVSNGSLDIAFSISYGRPCVAKNSELTSLKIYHNQMLMGVSQQNKNSSVAHLSLDMLRDLPILYFSLENSKFLQESFHASLSDQLNLKNVHRVTSIEQMHMLVALNQAMAFYPAGLISAQEMAEDKYVNYIPFDDHNDQSYDIVVLFKAQNKNLLLQKLLDILKKGVLSLEI